jgi:8-oxo-dGTP pyrophosphatase MutT (NUDIX family)
VTLFHHYPSVDVLVRGRTLLPPDVKREADRYWEDLRVAGHRFERGPVLRAMSLTTSDGAALVTAEWTDYAHLMASRAHRLPPEWDCQPVFGAALVETIDGRLVVGRMNPATASPGRWQLPGGGAEPADADDGRLCVRRLVGREVQEELGVGITHPAVARVEAVGAMLLASGAGGLALRVRLHWPFERLRTWFLEWSEAQRARGEVPEFTEIRGIPEDGELVGPLSPAARAWMDWWRAHGGTV